MMVIIFMHILKVQMRSRVQQFYNMSCMWDEGFTLIVSDVCPELI